MKVRSRGISSEAILRGISKGFAAAGQDGISLVKFLRILWKECELKAVDMQTAALPQPNCTLFLADVDATKVRYSTSN